MTISEIYNYLSESALNKVGVNSVYQTDPYNSWNVFQVKYGSVCVYIDGVVTDRYERAYKINLYYGDILTETSDNLFTIQNTAVEVLTAIIKDLREIEGVYLDSSIDINLFKQKFTDILGGGYCSFTMKMMVSDCDTINKTY